jgi:acyl carrier protein
MNTNIDTRTWLVDWFVRNVGLSAQDVTAKANENYFDLGWIDSLKFVNFILEIEQEFGVHFSNEDFQDRDFGTLEGLLQYINKKRSG